MLFIEATAMRGRGALTLTGQLGDVMKESAHAALSYARSHAKEFGIQDDFFAKHDIHVHVPEGAIPKGWTIRRRYDGNGHSLVAYRKSGSPENRDDW